jgi:hypothetical protein
MSVQTAAGAKFYIGPANSVADDTTAYGLLSYTEVAEVVSISEFGDTFNEITHTALSDSRVRKFKGSVNAGTITIELGLDVDDAGQAAVETARDVTAAATQEYAFKVELNDSLGSNPTTYYFRGLVMSYTQNVGEVESIVGSTVNVGINSQPKELVNA